MRSPIHFLKVGGIHFSAFSQKCKLASFSHSVSCSKRQADKQNAAK